MAFKTLGLSDPLVQGILATGYTAPTEIQARAIPVGLEGKDIIGTAQTGTGKTAAFVLPLLQHLSRESESHSKHAHPRALVLTPTRELAQQIENATTGYGRFLHLKALSVYGGANMASQMKHLQRGVDIVIATPGRLLDHLQRKSINLSHIQILVIDEADRMFDMGFINDVRKIISHVPSDRQTMMFSATMSKPVRDLMSAVQKHPVVIEIGERHSPVDTVRQSFYSVDKEQKVELLLFMLQSKELDSVLVFSRTKHGADKISRRLERAGVKVVAIHSGRTQAQRDRALAGFKQGQFRVLVATDVAARGIDVEGISHVINHDIPNFPEDYIHRIGRTGRATMTGDAITFIARDDVQHLKRLERFVGKRYEVKKYPGFVEQPHVASPRPVAPEARHQHPRSSQHPNSHAPEGRSHQRPPQHPHAPEGRPHNRPAPHGPSSEGRGHAKPSSHPQKRRDQFRKKPPKESNLPTSVLEGKPAGDWRTLLTAVEDRIKSTRKKFIRGPKPS